MTWVYVIVLHNVFFVNQRCHQFCIRRTECFFLHFHFLTVKLSMIILFTSLQTRPENVQKLLDLDLSVAGVKHLKEIMKGMGISSVGIFEKADLRKHLVQSVPELRMHLQSK